ncbi:Lariat debranching enzyme [Purpureocillium lavendulum]|uniref:Lariat debranching enzyme n=1 Tax=Purpureocillium lavendulum TaxID=1247861 RepID=A0AB34FMJ4_9HYPO|nr:Lariat debranching enzyme [Purpureocillium lavendulum]
MTSTTSVSDKDATRSAAAEEPIEAVPGQLLPTCSNLDRLREKFLSAYDGASILESKELPWYCIHRDFYETGPGRAPTGPIPGNDFHTTDPRITSFAENGHTPISFDTIALILGLLTSPSKDDRPHHFNDPFADRDVSWILDSLHGFCRQKSPHQAESERSLFFTLGTSSDFWMHFHFVFHTYALEEDALGTDDDGSGMRISRSKFTVPISFGGTQNSLNFFERRTWIGMRVATKHNGRVPSASPSAIAVSVSDLGRTDLDMSPRLWEQRGLKTPEDAAGVALFQMALWSHLEKWENDWTRTLRHVEDAFEVRLSDQADMDRLNEVIAKDCHDSAATCSRLILVLMGFRNHIEAVVDSVNKMHDEWARTYSGRHTERLERFDVETQEAVLDNWAAVLVHVGDASARLSARIQRSIATLRTIREGLFGSLLTRF